ncbi:MAG: zf-HC2 domain-containing protein [Candidatus Gastranaerophilales bacterium]|nr:zf-HC2 domain-containing protein [Candidatus Gastranaerophilales bacterium]
MRNGINCKLVSEHLSAFVDEELDFDFSSEIKRHLCECLDCRRKFAKMLKLHYLLKKYFAGESLLEHKAKFVSNLKFVSSVDFVTQK